MSEHELKKMIVEHYAAGVSMRNIARKFAMGNVKILKLIEEAGVPRRNPSPEDHPRQVARASFSGRARPEVTFAKEYGTDSPAEAVQKGLVDIMDWVAYLDERREINVGSNNSQGFSLELGQGN